MEVKIGRDIYCRTACGICGFGWWDLTWGADKDGDGCLKLHSFVNVVFCAFVVGVCIGGGVSSEVAIYPPWCGGGSIVR